MKKRLKDNSINKPSIVSESEEFNRCFDKQGDVSTKQEFTKQDLESIVLLDSQSAINKDLIEYNDSFKQEGNIHSLLAEGVLKNHLTGADLGIYQYKSIHEKKEDVKEIDLSKYSKSYRTEKIDENIVNYNSNLINDIDENYSYGFANCLLAEENPLGGEDTQIIITFKGYLEVTKSNFSIIRKCNVDNSNISLVYIPEYYIHKYQLRNGDEIMCTCKESEGYMIMESLLTINQIPYYDWNCNRPWFKDLSKNTKIKNLNHTGDYTEAIITKLGLIKGDNAFLYINKNSQKSQVIGKFIDELSEIFDKVIYINPQIQSSITIGNSHNVVRFCTNFTELSNNKTTIALLGANYARRLIELGQNVVIIIDDIDGITALDSENLAEMPVCKTILGSTKVSQKGSVTMFTLVSLRSDRIESHTPYSVETLGIVIDNNEVDLYNSYRI